MEGCTSECSNSKESQTALLRYGELTELYVQQLITSENPTMLSYVYSQEYLDLEQISLVLSELIV